MGYTVDLEEANLMCRSEAAAREATTIVTAHRELSPYHLEVAPWQRSSPPREDAWSLSIEHFQGDHWDDDAAKQLWLALAPHLADGATIEFQGEDRVRWRIRWEAGRVFEEYVHEVIWAVGQEIDPTESEPAPA